ncbi:hypothetical protein PV11_05227 [Exophiala sideris]|uniref:Uncharacterized protein n=1 Tax=Exophiala sideris TaxID=1016849 RepID=A0A0D1YJX4_9EURO|nr:hypothetical protein PV11_05227 [Exophiala sideris]
MAYAAVSQAEHDAFSNDSPDVTAQGLALPEVSSPPLSLSFDHLSRDENPSSASQAGQGAMRVGSLLKSFTSSQSYEMVEEEDYEAVKPSSPEGLGLNIKDIRPPQTDSTTFQSEEPEEPPIRTASISRNLPLKHPTPDLHALQGALVKNVERLEESAERLSTASSLEEELNKMKLDQKRLERQSSAPAALVDHPHRPSVQRQVSSSSWSNSILGLNQTARLGGYSPSAYITSPTGSIQSGRWSHQQSLENRPSKSRRRDQPPSRSFLENHPSDQQSVPPSNASVLPELEAVVDSPRVSNGSIPEDRPTTSSSNDTYRQAQAAFHDFDGVYCAPGTRSIRDSSLSRRISLQQPPLARDSKAYKEPQPGEKMIYYPAPVPVMLNLPQRLSKVDLGARERRRLQGLSTIPNEMRQSAPWLADQEDVKSQRSQRDSLNLPPQLRASAFFEQPRVTQNLQLKNGSAVQTLDSILDAAAYAPVTGFTDHPIAGPVGQEVYGQNKSPRKSTLSAEEKSKKRRSSLSTLLRRSSTGLSISRLSRTRSRDSKTMLGGDGYVSGDEADQAAAQSIAPDPDEIPDDNEDVEDTGPVGFSAAPTTLLAELQMRKAQQKQRNRTAADAFPNGMHSTLLELDAVTQLQQKSRKLKHVTLAWEDHDEADKHNFDDEDVPLGVLFPEKDRAATFNAQWPVGLLERREMEDNEPLSHRRARLRGAPMSMTGRTDAASQAPFISGVPGIPDLLDEPEDETLAQRAERLAAMKKQSAKQASANMSQESGLRDAAAQPSKTPDVEETLAQRKKRLQAEALLNGRQASGDGPGGLSRQQSMHSLAGILQAHPVGVRQVSQESKASGLGNARTPKPLLQFDNAATFPHMQMNMPLPPAQDLNWGYPQQNGVYVNGLYGNFYPNGAPYMNGSFAGLTPSIYGAPMPMHMQQSIAQNPYEYSPQPYVQDPMMGPPLDPKHRAQIDQWRQSIVQ